MISRYPLPSHKAGLALNYTHNVCSETGDWGGALHAAAVCHAARWQGLACVWIAYVEIDDAACLDEAAIALFANNGPNDLCEFERADIARHPIEISLHHEPELLVLCVDLYDLKLALGQGQHGFNDGGDQLRPVFHRAIEIDVAQVGNGAAGAQGECSSRDQKSRFHIPEYIPEC